MEISHLTTLNVYSVLSYCKYRYFLKDMGNAIPNAIPNFATEREPKRNFLYFTYVTLVVVDIKSERFVKRMCLQQDLFDMTMVTIMFDRKSSKSESFNCRGVYEECPSYDASPSYVCWVFIIHCVFLKLVVTFNTNTKKGLLISL